MKTKSRIGLGMASALAVAAIVVGASGCGGGGGAGSPGGSGTGDQIIFDNGQTAVVAETAKQSDEATVTSVIAANPSVTASQMASLIVAKMQTLADFRRGGISTSGDPWGEFKDGTLYGVNVSDPSFFALPSAPAANKRANKPVVISKTSGTTSTTFPGSTKAYVLYGVEAARPSPSTQLSSEFTAAGYSVTFTNDGVADWSKIAGAGILVNDGHGGNVLGKFYVSTADVQTPALDKQYASYLSNKAMMVMGVTVYDTATTQHTEQRYWLSIDYLKSLPNYSSMFAANSLFMDVVCSGDSKEAANFWGPMQTGAGLGDYAGWSQPVGDGNATETAEFYFDRMLGLNQQAPVDPSLPPPGNVAQTAALLATTGRSGSGLNMNQDAGGNVFSFHMHGSLTNIIPSIASVAQSTDGTKWIVQGAFGSDSGSVTYGGAAVTPLSWTDSEIDIPVQTTSGSVVVKSPTGLISNGFATVGKPTLSPTASKIQQGGSQLLKVTIGAGLKGSTYSYQWTNTSKYGSIADSSGNKGASFTSPNGSVTYTPTPNLYGTDTVTVETFLVQANGTKTSIGKATATVEVDPSGTLSISPVSGSIDQTQTQPISVSIQGGVTGATYRYNWTNTAKFGTIADANGLTGPSFTSSLGAVTYKPTGTAGSDTVTVEVFVVAADSTLHSLGTQECPVSVAVKSLIFTPSDGNLTVSQTQVFSVAPITGSFPTGATFAWDLTGRGLINGVTTVTTTVPKVTYVAPSTIGAADLDVIVKDSKGNTIASGTQSILVSTVAISPASYTFTGPGATVDFSAKGTFPSGTTFKWSCTTGGLSAKGAPPYVNALTTTSPGVSYLVGNPPPDGSPASDTLTVTAYGPTGTSLGSASAPVKYGGTPFFIATYPYTGANNKIVTSYVGSGTMTDLIGNLTNYGQAYGIQDTSGFLDLIIDVPTGTALTPGLSVTLDEQSPITKTGVFYVAGALVANAPNLVSGTLTINSVIPDPGVNGNFIGFSMNVLCVGGQSIIANGVVLQHF